MPTSSCRPLRKSVILVTRRATRGQCPARAIARKHKAAVESWIAEAFAAAGVVAPRERSREVMLLMEGAMLLMLIHGDRGYAKAAADAAKRLMKS